MNEATKIAILSFSTVSRDARVLRQVEYLSRCFSVTAIGYGQLNSRLAGRVRMIPVKPPSSLQRRGRKTIFLPLARLLSSSLYDVWYWHEDEYQQALNILLANRFDAIHANDWESLPLALRAARKTGARVVADLHEYAPLMRENRRYWRWFYKPMVEYFLRQHLPQISGSVTVGSTIARQYESEYSIEPVVVRNVPHYTRAPVFRPTEPDHIKLIHHGNAIRDRRLELMIQTVAQLDPRYSLHFMLVDRSRGYICDLKALARRIAPNRVFFHDPVPPSEIIDRISEFDIGIYLMPSANFNQLAALPNKFFDFIAAGLAVCIGPSPEMAAITDRYSFGLVSPSLEPTQVAKTLGGLSSGQIDTMKRAALQARLSINADVEMSKLVHLYKQLLGENSQPETTSEPCKS